MLSVTKLGVFALCVLTPWVQHGVLRKLCESSLFESFPLSASIAMPSDIMLSVIMLCFKGPSVYKGALKKMSESLLFDSFPLSSSVVMLSGSIASVAVQRVMCFMPSVYKGAFKKLSEFLFNIFPQSPIVVMLSVIMVSVTMLSVAVFYVIAPSVYKEVLEKPSESRLFQSFPQPARTSTDRRET
jgi:hypothetical protein